MPPNGALLSHLLRAPAETAACADVGAWWPRYRALCQRWSRPIERSVAGGFDADRVGWAFAAGYQGALRALVPDLPDDAVAALCVTEETGNRPADVRTTLAADGRGWRLQGAKRWTTLGPASTVLLVAARVAPDTGPRPSLKVARVSAHAPGVALEPMPPTRFVPEVPHARIRLQDVPVGADAVLEGDGYERYVKPFRTREDTHIDAALLGYLLREARLRGWPADWTERALACLAALITVSELDAADPATHVTLAGVLAGARALFDEAGALFAAAADEAATRWARDAALLQVAAGARAQRLARAWERLSPLPPSA